jgi:hypothetical protein
MGTDIDDINAAYHRTDKRIRQGKGEVVLVRCTRCNKVQSEAEIQDGECRCWTERAVEDVDG